MCIEAEFVYDRHSHKAREHKEIGIHAVRGGSIVGEHEVIFAGKDEFLPFPIPPCLAKSLPRVRLRPPPLSRIKKRTL